MKTYGVFNKVTKKKLYFIHIEEGMNFPHLKQDEAIFEVTAIQANKDCMELNSSGVAVEKTALITTYNKRKRMRELKQLMNKNERVRMLTELKADSSLSASDKTLIQDKIDKL